jgi:hypothetical protein
VSVRTSRKPIDLDAELVGRELAAISFVRDYVEFHFDGPVVRALSDPSGSVDGVAWSFADRSTVATMLDLIGREVVRVVLDAARALTIELCDATITVPLDDDHRTGPEALNVMHDEGGMSIW